MRSDKRSIPSLVLRAHYFPNGGIGPIRCYQKIGLELLRVTPIQLPCCYCQTSRCLLEGSDFVAEMYSPFWEAFKEHAVQIGPEEAVSTRKKTFRLNFSLKSAEFSRIRVSRTRPCAHSDCSFRARLGRMAKILQHALMQEPLPKSFTGSSG